MSYTCTKRISVTVVEAGKEEPNGVYRGIYVDVYPNEWIIWSDFIYQLSFVPSVFIYTCCLYMHYGWYNVWTIIWNHLRSEEHTSELQSRFDLVCRLLLEKKNHIIYISIYISL